MPETMMKMPALAVVGPDRRIIRSTETFRRRYENADKICEKSAELDRVLTGHVDAATISVGELSVAVEAVTDASGRRQAMLTLPPADTSPGPEPPVSALRDAAEESPAIVWVKDLEGRYLFANSRYETDLGTSQERLCGHTDADLPEADTVDGPRLRYAEDGLEEPLQLEYTVPAVDVRPALAAFRFAVRDETGKPVATCGVAAPVSEAQVAREEAVRLMQLERWNRLDPIDVRAELLEQWHVQAAPPQPFELEPRVAPESAPQPQSELAPASASEPPAPLEVPESVSRPTEVAAASPPAPPSTLAQSTLSETAELLQTNLELARKWADRAEELQSELREAHERIRQVETDAEQATVEAARAAEEADRCRSELDQTRSELEQTRSELGAARAEAESLRGPSAAALKLSEELGRAVATERERSDELERTLAQLRSRLVDFETALDGNSATLA